MKDDIEHFLVKIEEHALELLDVSFGFFEEMKAPHARQVHEYDARVDAVRAIVGQAVLGSFVVTRLTEAVGRQCRYLLAIELGKVCPQFLKASQQNGILKGETDREIGRSITKINIENGILILPCRDKSANPGTKSDS